jgi:hypothetical protein
MRYQRQVCDGWLSLPVFMDFTRTVAVSYETGMKAHTLFTTTYIHAAPRDAVLPSMRKTGAKGRVRHQMIGAMQDLANGFRRIPIPALR